MNLINRIKFFLQKRLTPFSVLRWDIRSIIKGNRKSRYTIVCPVNLRGKQHIHIYPMLQCNLDCYFCQNKFYTDKLPYFRLTSSECWAIWINNMYNFHHIDIQGGEPLLFPGIVNLLNSLKYHNIVVFTNLPKLGLKSLKFIKTKTNNITLNVSYHPLAEKRDIAEFAEDYLQIPKRLKPSLHVIDIPEISYKNIRAAFAAKGIYIEGLSAIIPTKHNKIKNSFKTVLCKSNMDCIAPDLTVYPCTGLMLRKIGGVHISKYKFNNDFIRCNYYGLCGPCTSMKEIRNVESR